MSSNRGLRSRVALALLDENRTDQAGTSAASESAKAPGRRGFRSQSVHVRGNVMQPPPPPPLKKRKCAKQVHNPPVQQVDENIAGLSTSISRLSNELITVHALQRKNQDILLKLLPLQYSKDQEIIELKNIIKSAQHMDTVELSKTNVRIINAYMDDNNQFKKVIFLLYYLMSAFCSVYYSQQVLVSQLHSLEISKLLPET